MSQPITNLKDIKYLTDLDDLLSKAEVSTTWGSRRFILHGKNGEKYVVKMKDIVAKFEKYAPGCKDKHLIGNIRDRIVKLDFLGEKKLSVHGRMSMIFRNIGNVFSSSHLTKIDEISERLFTNEVISIANEISRKLKSNEDLSNYANELINQARGEESDRSPQTENAIRYLTKTIPKMLAKS